MKITCNRDVYINIVMTFIIIIMGKKDKTNGMLYIQLMNSIVYVMQ